MHRAGARTFATNSLFGAFLLSVSGWGLFHAWALGAGAGVSVHALIAIPGLTLSGLLLYRYSLHWPACAPGAKEGGRLSSCGAAIVPYLLLPAIGVAMSLLVHRASLLVVAVAAAGLILTPWTRVAFCRDHFLVSAGLAGTGGVAGLALWEQPSHPMHYPLCGWIFLLLAMSGLAVVMVAHRNRTERMPAGGY